MRRRFENVATPPAAATVVVLPPVNAAGPFAVTVTFAVLAVKLPAASRMRTVTAGAIACPACVSAGCWRNVSCFGAPDVTTCPPDRLPALPLEFASPPYVASTV